MAAHEVIIIGGGPAGLGLAIALHKRGMNDIIVLERDAEIGGVPRHCGHWGFGWESHRRLLTGPVYAERLRREAKDIDVRTNHTVVEFRSGNILRVHAPKSAITDMEAKQIVLATGAREASRAARLIGGTRSAAAINTGMLQQLVYLKRAKPFSRPVILGGEWVSFSALMTCHHAGIKPVAMIVEDQMTDAPGIFTWGARLRYGVAVHTATRVIAIHGGQKVEAVEVEYRGKRRLIDCDGVIVSGQFVPEDTLLKGHVKVSPALAGNVDGALKTAGRCVAEARLLADHLLAARP